jgi:hypothetical protein
LSALRFIVAVSFFDINVRVLDSLMNAPSNSPWRLRRNCMDVESKLYGLTEETTECAKLRHKSGHAAEKRGFAI